VDDLAEAVRAHGESSFGPPIIADAPGEVDGGSGDAVE
jgi:hypothetical protein